MAKHAIHVTEDVHALLKERIRPGESYNKLLRELIDRQPPVAVNGETTLADAAERILESLRPETKNIVYELCQTHQRNPEDYVLSWCKLAEDQGNTTFVLGEQALHNATDGRSRFQEPRLPVDKTCEYCGKTYKPKRHDQRFCPADLESAEPSCGKKFHMAQIHGAVPRDPEFLDEETKAFMQKTVNEPRTPRPNDMPVPTHA